MYIKSMSWSTRRISEESVYSYRVSTCRNDCISCIVSKLLQDILHNCFEVIK